MCGGGGMEGWWGAAYLHERRWRISVSMVGCGLDTGRRNVDSGLELHRSWKEKISFVLGGETVDLEICWQMKNG